ncbi:MAG TPA: hypothetical protein VGX94_11515 [Terriglobia bacterium]|nr:hypothetical protein [Terriglobia bacterium]
MAKTKSHAKSSGEKEKPVQRAAKSDKKIEKPEACFDVLNLPPDVKKQVRKWLIEGAPFEDVVERVAEPGEVTITQRAVEHYFRSAPAVQAARITHQTRVADKLVKALRDPKSTEAKLARSVLVMGLSGLNRGGETNRVKHAMQMIKEQRDERLKEADSQRKEAKLEFEEQEFQIRVQSLQAKLQLATFQLDRLRDSIEKKGKSKALGPEILQQINEIYGIVTTPGSEEMSGDACDVQA